MITSDANITIITDPYGKRDDLSYRSINESADIVTISHEHSDHNNAAAIKDKPQVIRRNGVTKVKAVEFKGIPSYHDESMGSKRGNNIMFCFKVDNLRICHLGDLGHQLSDKQVSELGKIDILLIPVGGFYTIDANAANEVCNCLKPRVIIPMHFKNEKCAFPIASVDEFLIAKERVTHPDTSEVEFKHRELPSETQVIVLKPAQ
jgi:L-ascorbate metabolism protein UlaG (beta-lactamase superfamily)